MNRVQAIFLMGGVLISIGIWLFEDLLLGGKFLLQGVLVIVFGLFISLFEMFEEM